MSTKSSIKFEWDEATGDYFHVYMDGLEYENVYLELTGFPIKVEGEIKPNPGLDRKRIAVSAQRLAG